MALPPGLGMSQLALLGMKDPSALALFAAQNGIDLETIAGQFAGTDSTGQNAQPRGAATSAAPTGGSQPPQSTDGQQGQQQQQQQPNTDMLTAGLGAVQSAQPAPPQVVGAPNSSAPVGLAAFNRDPRVMQQIMNMLSPQVQGTPTLGALMRGG